MLAVVFGVSKLRMYLSGRRFVVATDHRNLLHLANLKTYGPQSGRLMRWAQLLSQFDMHIEHHPGTTMADPDALSRAPVPSNPADSPDESTIVPAGGTLEDDMHKIITDSSTTEGGITFTGRDGKLL